MHLERTKHIYLVCLVCLVIFGAICYFFPFTFNNNNNMYIPLPFHDDNLSVSDILQLQKIFDNHFKENSRVAKQFNKIKTKPISKNVDLIKKTNNLKSDVSKPYLQKSPNELPLPCKNPFRNEYTQKKNYICCHPLGGLGNQMFVYASAYGIAAKLNRTLILPSTTILSNVFNLSAKQVDDYECVIKGTVKMVTKHDCALDEHMFRVPKDTNRCVGNHLQSYKYFQHVAEDLNKQFTFHKDITQKASGILRTAVESFRSKVKLTSSKAFIFVGVHVRRGGIVNNSYGYNVATAGYMQRAMGYFRNKYQNVLFIVCSNGMDWAKENVKGNDVYFVEGNKYDVDMNVLTSCNHTLSTLGTFSWWAGYLTGGEVVYYQWPAKEGSRLRPHLRYEDYFLPSWKGMK